MQTVFKYIFKKKNLVLTFPLLEICIFYQKPLFLSSYLDRPVLKEDSGLARCVLHVFVDSCKDLNANKAVKPSPKVISYKKKQLKHT